METVSEGRVTTGQAVSQNGFSSPSELARLLQRYIQKGRITLIEPSGARTECGFKCDTPPLIVRVVNERLQDRLLTGGSRALGESYAEGWWTVEGDRLRDLFSVLFANNVDRLFTPGLLGSLFSRLRSWRPLRSKSSVARDDIRLHYDLSNEFFAQMLDSSMTYSCGYARTPGDSLEHMQIQKLDRIARKLGLKKGGTLVDIGCGWGGLLAYVGRTYPNVSGLGITLSLEQYEFTRERLRAEGLADRFRVQLLDFRDLKGEFDYVVSVGMFEHVGLDSYGDFFSTVRALLKPTGSGLLHTIGLEEEPFRLQDGWMNRYIFPGSRLPRLEELARAARLAELAIGHVENWRPHYALTLRHWREKFISNWPQITRLGKRFDNKFFRMWDFYLQLCEACFIDSTVELYQLMLSPRPAWNFPLRFEFRDDTAPTI